MLYSFLKSFISIHTILVLSLFGNNKKRKNVNFVGEESEKKKHGSYPSEKICSNSKSIWLVTRPSFIYIAKIFFHFFVVVVVVDVILCFRPRGIFFL